MRLAAAWFAGSYEGHPDVGIWLSHFDGEGWDPPTLVANEDQVPLWNPVLFRDAESTLWLFYKAGPDVSSWTGFYMKSSDGETWTSPEPLPAGLVGPAKNKPLLLSNGDILCGSSQETWRSWSCWAEISHDGGVTWSKRGPITAPEGDDAPRTMGDEPVSATWDPGTETLSLPQSFPGVIQPTLWEEKPGHVKMLMRATRSIGRICMAESRDAGRHWLPASKTRIPNPNSGIDAVRLEDGRVVLACNPTEDARTPLSLLVSEDGGESWRHGVEIESGPGEYSYPSIIQASDGRIHGVYTYRRQQIRHCVLDPLNG